MKRSELVQAVAKAAHDAHYCAYGYRGELCGYCQTDGRKDCFELSGSSELDPSWTATAEAALETIEKALGVRAQD